MGIKKGIFGKPSWGLEFGNYLGGGNVWEIILGVGMFGKPWGGNLWETILTMGKKHGDKEGSATVVSPRGATVVSPRGAIVVSPRGATVVSPRGATVVSP